MLIILVSLLPQLEAQNTRRIPLDFYLIVDDSLDMRESKNDAIAWLNEQLLERAFINGDKITLFSAGDRVQTLYSQTISSPDNRQEITERLQAMEMAGQRADFTGALRSAVSEASRSADRLPVYMLITGTAGGLVPALTGPGQELFRWFRSERYERWQVLVMGPEIGQRVRQAANSFMNAQ